MRRLFRDMTIRKKIQLINVLIILPSIVFLTVALHQMTLGQVQERARRSSEQKIELIASTIATLFNDIENFSKLSMINKTHQSVLTKTNEGESELQQLDDLQSMYESLNTLVAANPYIDSAVVQSSGGDKMYHSDNMSNVTARTAEVYPKGRLAEAKGAAVWIETFESPFLVNDRHKRLLSIGRRIININNGRLIGYICINVDERKLSRMYSGDEAASKIMIVNETGSIVSSSDPEYVYRSVQSIYGPAIAAARGSAVYNDGKTGILVSTKPLGKAGWRAVYAIPVQELMKEQRFVSWFILGFGGAGLLLALVLSSILSRWITAPIMRLSKAMTAVGDGHLGTRAPVESNDEVGRLTYKFNEMVSRIQDLMRAVNLEEKQKRMLELRLSHAQIKPHFLYNTLEMVRSMALMVQARDIAKVVKALGDFYRTSLNRGQEFVTAEQEKKHLESYLYIQKMRYSHIGYRIDFDPSVEGSRIPGMLLQPIVENAIYHGLRNKRAGAMCEIAGSAADIAGRRILIFSVKDNGEGMSAERLRRLWLEDEDERGLSSFGIRSVHDRIRLRYGPEYGLTIDSRPGEGVEVRLRLPLVPPSAGERERG